MQRTTRTGQVYEQTCVLIPVELKQDAKAAGISLAGTFRKALKAELEAHNNAANKNNPIPLRQDQNGDTTAQGSA